MKPTLDNKTVLVTGGTGSFGKTMTMNLLNSGAKEIRVFSRDEAKQDEMRHSVIDDRMRYYLGDVRDYSSLNHACTDVDLVFHAAALKQVPSGEFFPLQAIKTNVLGSENVIRAAENSGVQSLVCLSTDKAVYPVNAMGMSKALMEKLAIAHGLNAPNATTTVSCVRYGNVMYSRGSVIPLFIRQLKDKIPLTVTDPEMTRFMMSLQDSVALVNHAFFNGNQGDLFIKKAPACSVGTLAQALGELYKISPKITVIGTRHAEKKYEVLASQEELSRSEDMGDFIKVRADNRDLNYAPYFEKGDASISRFEDYTSDNTKQLDVEGTMNLLLTLPEIQQTL